MADICGSGSTQAAAAALAQATAQASWLRVLSGDRVMASPGSPAKCTSGAQSLPAIGIGRWMFFTAASVSSGGYPNAPVGCGRRRGRHLLVGHWPPMQRLHLGCRQR